MLEFKDCPVVDNHAHTLDPKTQTLEPIWLARKFHHGMADLPTPGVAATKPGAPRRISSFTCATWGSS